MATAKPKAKKTAGKKTSGQIDKNLLAALKTLEDLAITQIGSAKDPFKTGIGIIAEIKKVTMRIETEIEDDSRCMTEAYDSGPGVVGVGLGVF
ncbi:MAG: hypothetical protein ACYDHW_16930 [Syntrophorhabdaceae bacterium]